MKAVEKSSSTLLADIDPAYQQPCNKSGRIDGRINKLTTLTRIISKALKANKNNSTDYSDCKTCRKTPTGKL